MPKLTHVNKLTDPRHHAGVFVTGFTKTGINEAPQEVKGYFRAVTPTRIILETLEGAFVAVVAFK